MKKWTNIILKGIATMYLFGGHHQTGKEMLKELDGMSNEEIEAKIKESNLIFAGQCIGFVLIASLLIFACVLTSRGHSNYGIVLGILAFALPVISFLKYGK